MTLTSIEKDTESKTMTMTAHFDASVDRVWEMFANPRLLERWWGPPTHPATFVDHDLRPGGRATYFMTGPEGEKYQGWWRVLSVERLTEMGMEEGLNAAIGQMDALLAESGPRLPRGSG